jgi:hypothetical protein
MTIEGLGLAWTKPSALSSNCRDFAMVVDDPDMLNLAESLSDPSGITNGGKGHL